MEQDKCASVTHLLKKIHFRKRDSKLTIEEGSEAKHKFPASSSNSGEMSIFLHFSSANVTLLCFSPLQEEPR